MALNINGTTGISGVDGSVSAPAVTGTDSNTGITFPSADTIKFSTGGVERMQISNSGVTGTGVGGKFASYAIIADVKPNNTSGGAFTNGAWRTRDLNTEVSDPDGIVSISSNQFVLQSGTYFVRATAPAMQVNKHKIKLYNISDSADVQLGTSSRAGSSDSTQTRSELSTRFTIGSAKTYEIRHRCETTQSNGYGMGNESDFSTTELYTIVEIFKES